MTAIESGLDFLNGRRPGEVDTIILTVDQAKALLLEAEGHNPRPFRSSTAAAYKRDMQEGRWVQPGPGLLMFSEGGKLVDGQHRLSAFVESGLSRMTFTALFGASWASVANTDSGRKRTLSQVLTYMGEARTPQLAAALKMLFLWQHDKIGCVFPATMSELLELLSTDDGTLRNAVLLANRTSKVGYRNIGSGLHSLIVYLALVHLGEDVAKQWIDEMRGDLPTGLNHPIQRLNKVLGPGSDSRYLELTTRQCQAIFIKGWNAWVQGKTVHMLYWHETGPKAEPFPSIIVNGPVA